MRQKRYNIGTIDDDTLSEIKDKKANIVFKDGRVAFGVIVAVSDRKVSYQNMRMRRSEVDFSQISEIIVDFKV